MQVDLGQGMKMRQPLFISKCEQSRSCSSNNYTGCRSSFDRAERLEMTTAFNFLQNIYMSVTLLADGARE
jgi:hypothetical protein